MNLPDPNGITGVVNKDFTFEGEEVLQVPNAALGKWYQDRDNSYYWGGALSVVDNSQSDAGAINATDNASSGSLKITPSVKNKIEQVVNVFETGSAQGRYGTLVKLKDHKEPDGTFSVQVTYGRSQTTEFSNLAELVQDYVDSNALYANILSPYIGRIGQKPSLATDDVFCNALISAGKSDPIMKKCQDELFDTHYYQPAFNWFTVNGFTLPLSMLVIYDSTIHSGSVPLFLRKKFPTAVPANGGDEKEWITNYVNARNNWLANNSNPLLQGTVYRTKCFQAQIQNNNWDIAQPINAHGVVIA